MIVGISKYTNPQLDVDRLFLSSDSMEDIQAYLQKEYGIKDLTKDRYKILDDHDLNGGTWDKYLLKEIGKSFKVVNVPKMSNKDKRFQKIEMDGPEKKKRMLELDSKQWDMQSIKENLDLFVDIILLTPTPTPPSSSGKDK
jgi:hypothetical protein